MSWSWASNWLPFSAALARAQRETTLSRGLDDETALCQTVSRDELKRKVYELRKLRAGRLRGLVELEAG